MEQEEYRPPGKVVAAAVTAIAATYFYFLIFVQFSFLKTVQGLADGAPEVIRPILGAMGLAGIAGSLLAARIYATERGRWLLAIGFGLCALAAASALLAGTRAHFFAVAMLAGLGTGITTVTLASALRAAVGGARLGTVIGGGTGTAYALCNLPPVFDASAGVQTVLAVVAAGIGLVATVGLTLDAPGEKPKDPDYTAPRIAIWVLVFFALVGVDSMAFFVIQHTPVLKDDAWSGAGRLGLNAGVHLVAALMAGYALDRRWIGGTVLAGASALLAACLMIEDSDWTLGAGVTFYAAGVSVYSAALVFYPARSQRPWLAATVYSVAGWCGSGLGIDLAGGQHELPRGFAGVAGVVIGVALAVREFSRRHGRGGVVG